MSPWRFDYRFTQERVRYRMLRVLGHDVSSFWKVFCFYRPCSTITLGPLFLQREVHTSENVYDSEQRGCIMEDKHKRHPVLIVGPVPPPFHGPAVNTKALLEHPIINRKFEVVHLDTSDPRPLRNLGKIDFGNIWLALKHAVMFLVVLVQSSPGIVYISISQNIPGFIRDCLLMIPSILAGRKLVIHLRGSYFRQFYESSPWPLKKLITWVLHHTSRMIVLGDNLRALFDGLMQAHRVVVVPNGLDSVPFDRLRQQGVGALSKPDFQVTYLGTLTEEKGCRHVLQAIPKVLQVVPDVRFTLAGDFVRPQDRRYCVQFVREHNLADVASLPGVVTGDVKIRLLLNSDIFVFPPVAPEGLPMVILEAMAAGLPIITTDQGAIRETVIDGVNGFIVPEGNPEAIAEKIVLLLKDEDLRKRMGQASRERFFRHYTLDRWGKDMVRVFQDVLEED